jgi:hypothetical protein
MSSRLAVVKLIVSQAVSSVSPGNPIIALATVIMPVFWDMLKACGFGHGFNFLGLLTQNFLRTRLNPKPDGYATIVRMVC